MNAAEDIADLMRTIMTTPGTTEPSARDAAARGTSVPPLLQDYIVKVRSDSHRITDADISRLRGNGYSEDDIFEMTIAAAYGIAARGLEAALRAMKADR